MSTRRILEAFTLAAALAAAAAMAHGDGKDHARAFDPARVEQTAFGQEGDPRKVTRTVKVDMSDAMRFTPAKLAFKKGETVRFIVTNSGNLLHEMVLGTPADLASHAQMMRKSPEMQHAQANLAHVPPGKSGAIVWQFTRSGEFSFACLQPGHFEAGMVGKVAVQ